MNKENVSSQVGNPFFNIKLPNSIWQDVHSDLVAGVKAFSQSISLSDIMADGDWRLILADVSLKLKVFKGQSLQNEAKLLFTPVAIVSFYAPDTNARNCVPYLAVAGGPYIFVYKNLKGTFKFVIPNVEPLQSEVSIWNDLKEDKTDSSTAIKALEEIENKSEFSARSLELLSIKEKEKQITFIDERKHLPIVISNFVVCMTTLKKNNTNDLIATSQIIVGTEGGFVFVIDHSGSKIISKFKIPDIPSQIISLGAYDVDYRLHIAARNNKIYTIKNGELTTVIIDVASKILGMVRTEKSLILATIDDYYQSYSPQGKKKFSIKMPHSISNLEVLDASRTRNFKGVIITLKNGEVRVYNEKNLLNIIKLNENIFGVKFGKFGKDEERLILITDSGSLIIKSLIQNINLDTISYNPQKKTGEELALNVPKKTKFYVDLIEREKESAVSMNNAFQTDMVRLRHKTLDTYVKMLKIGNGPTNYSSTSSVKLSASLQGLGPHFKLNLTIDNAGEVCITLTDLVVDYDKNIFCFDKDFLGLGLLMPNVAVKYSLRFKNVSENGVSGNIKIIVLDKARNSPLITSTVKVPISELEIL